MLRRTITAIALLAIAVPVVLRGGIPYFAFIGFFIVIADPPLVIASLAKQSYDNFIMNRQFYVYIR